MAGQRRAETPFSRTASRGGDWESPWSQATDGHLKREKNRLLWKYQGIDHPMTLGRACFSSWTTSVWMAFGGQPTTHDGIFVEN
jgi:hypothetical protein